LKLKKKEKLVFIFKYDIIVSEGCELALQIDLLGFGALDDDIGRVCCTSDLNSHKMLLNNL